MLFLAARALYGEMKNLKGEFDNKMEKINDTVVVSVETGTIKKSTDFQFKRLCNVLKKVIFRFLFILYF